MPISVPTVEELLEICASYHRHTCPRQVLGVRMGLWAGELLGLEVPQQDKRLLAIVETDGCFADGVAVAANCWVGRRTLRVEDYGKIAATFMDTRTNLAFRIAPQPDIRERARAFAPEARNRWEAMLLGYQRLPVEELLSAQSVRLVRTVEEIVSHAGRRVNCDVCGEEIVNEREVQHEGQTLCRWCAEGGYYVAEPPANSTAASAGSS